ncbi:MAG: Thymidine phosphorylase [Bacteriovoracaceae bacterium]|nr:Thymidine phosphorylase [Bacteriovoracaceae bacterium]
MTDLLSLIYKKRDGLVLSADEINGWISSLTSRTPPPDYQISALLAFIFQKGMNEKETATLTEAMRQSGKQFEYKNFPKGALFVDKHSTGGVGDKITLPLAPLVAACRESLYFPTISGRGLGHTGGTIDKLESIPGLKIDRSLEDSYKILKKHRVCFLGQTKDIVPADRILYALRDVTGTVESIPLITASILSKKLSENLDFLILDLKSGSGAFLPKLELTDKLAASLSSVARESEVPCNVFVTRMDTPLGHYSGHRLEVKESLAILKGEGPAASTELTKKFTERFLIFSGFASEDAVKTIDRKIQTGEAFEKFKDVIEAQGGSLVKFEKAVKENKMKTKVITAKEKGFLHFDVRKLGLALVELGGGRKSKTDIIDNDVGFYHPFETGDRVEEDQEVLKIYYRDKKKLDDCLQVLETAVQIKIESFPKSPLIRKVLV